MTVTHLCDILRKELLENSYEYGFLLNGVRVKPDFTAGFDREYDRLARTAYRVQPASLTRREKIGTCIEAVLVMKELLDQQGVPNKIWLLFQLEKGKAHTVLTFQAEGKTVYLELTPQSAKPWYGRELVYDSEETFQQAYYQKGFEIIDVTEQIEIGQPPRFLLERLNKTK